MRVIVTCGPGSEPIDEVRRITNFSTGELGMTLTAELMKAGHEVICMKGAGATSCVELLGAKVVGFSTSANLLERLHELNQSGVGAVFHAAALCDYEVKSIHTADGSAMTARKIPTLAGELTLTLRPARKILPLLAGMFPGARVVGWKYELNGNHDAAVMKAREQIFANGTDACVVNGAAWGEGFGFIEPDREPVVLPNKPSLCAFLAKWLAQK